MDVSDITNSFHLVVIQHIAFLAPSYRPWRFHQRHIQTRLGLPLEYSFRRGLILQQNAKNLSTWENRWPARHLGSACHSASRRELLVRAQTCQTSEAHRMRSL